MTDEETKVVSARAVPRSKPDAGPTIVLLAGDYHEHSKAKSFAHNHEDLKGLNKLAFLTEIRLDRLQKHDVVVAVTRGDGAVDPRNGECREPTELAVSKPVKVADHWDAAAEAGGVVIVNTFMAALAQAAMPAFPKAREGILRLGYV